MSWGRVGEFRCIQHGRLAAAEGLQHGRLPQKAALGPSFQDISDRLENQSSSLEKTSVKIHHAQVRLKLLHCLWLGKTPDGGHSLLERPDATGGHTVAQVVRLPNSPLALLGVDDQPVVGQKLENSADVDLVLCRRPAGNQNIIHVDKHKIQAEEDFIQKPLERLSSIFESKQHSQKLKKTKRRKHRRFGHILRRHWDLMIAFPEINLGEKLSTGQPGHQVSNVGAGIAIRKSLKVKAVKITAWPPCPIFLPHHMERRSPRTFRPPHNALPLHLLKLLLGCLEFSSI